MHGNRTNRMQGNQPCNDPCDLRAVAVPLDFGCCGITLGSHARQRFHGPKIAPKLNVMVLAKPAKCM